MVAFIERSGKPLCVICNTMLIDFNDSSLNRHYDTNHGHFHCRYPQESEICSHTIMSLKEFSTVSNDNTH